MKYVIIGNSAAAIGTIQGIRQIDKTGQIVVISDEKYHTYSRPLISYWLKGDVTEENMRYRDEDFYEKNDVDTLFETRVTKINSDKKTVTIKNGNEISYDKLMVATGSKPFVPPMEGLDKVKNKFTFMKLDDAKAVKETAAEGAKVLIVGAGLIGLKAAEALEHYGADMTVIDLADRILPSILDEEASAIMQKHIESKGVKFILGTSVKEFSESSAVLTNGETVQFDMVILAVGVRPNTELIAEAGGKVNRGIVTDQKQAVHGLKDVYAAGDCTESLDITTGQQKILALLPNAFLQGEAAGQNMAGKETYYLNAMPMNAIGFFGLHIITAGSYDGEAYTYTDGSENYKKLVTKDNELKGFILMGDVKRAGIYTYMIKWHMPIDECDFELLKTKPQLMAFSRSYRNEKLAGGYGNGD
ncbi:MAG: NAD(P)/FAD-dependent oxidoreductase [Oscillospiraceae bacterium]|jgi:NAD(P)H-nitrite reductase large subunit|nr:NAD(P)/FAD-dependent oxidoreductase [Oscillospiraceae bacterium]